ncbi:dodecin family protein [Dyella japonica]|uniref:Flavin-binding protein dodecin n=1 Tax=Dyella japonica TaxID=231455 RepID=A0ABV2JQM5_9GAMM
MSSIAKTIEVVASSKIGLDDAVQGGLNKVSRTIENIQGAWVRDITVRTSSNGTIIEWRARLRVTFVVE